MDAALALGIHGQNSSVDERHRIVHAGAFNLHGKVDNDGIINIIARLTGRYEIDDLAISQNGNKLVGMGNRRVDPESSHIGVFDRLELCFVGNMNCNIQ